MTRSAKSLSAALAVALLSGSASAETLKLTEADNGKNFAVHPGDSVEIRLSENPSTGFQWQGEATGLKLTGRNYESGAAIPGAPGVAVFRYVTEKAEAATIALRYARTWEKDTPPAQSFSARFDIKP